MQESDNAVFRMEGRVVENDGIAGSEFRNQRLFQPLKKEVSIAITAEDNRGDQACVLQPCDEIDALARGAAAWFLRFAPLSPGRPAVRVRFIAVHARLIYPDALVLGNFFQLF